jgi:hypothetical protein
MKRILSGILLSLILCVSLSFSQDQEPFDVARMSIGVMGGGGTASGVTYGCPTCAVDLRLEDNAANTTVINDGTGADWVSSTNTSGLTSATHTEGAASFLLTASTNRIYSPANWTSEKFEVTFYMKLESANAPANARGIWEIGSGVLVDTPNSNEISLNRSSGNALRLSMKGAGGTGYTWTSTNWVVDTNWHKYTITVNASTAAWTSVVIIQDTTTLEWDITTLPTAAAVFGALMNFGCSTADREIDAYFDVITVKDNT